MEQQGQTPHVLELAVKIGNQDITRILCEYLQSQLGNITLETNEQLYTDNGGNSYREQGELISSNPSIAAIVNALNVIRQGHPQIGPWRPELTARERPTVLIVDDEPAIRALFSAQLEGVLDIDIIEANDGVEALALCKQNPPDLVVLDMCMPNKDGFETGKDLARLGIPFIANTSLDDNESILRISQIGSLSYLIKPARPAQVLGVVASALAQVQQINSNKGHKNSDCEICTARGAISALLSIPPGQAYEVLKEMGRDNHSNTRDTAATVNKFLEFMAKAKKKFQNQQLRQHNKPTKPR